MIKREIKMNYKRNKFFYGLKKWFSASKYKRKYNYSFQKVNIPHDPILVLCNCCTKDDAQLVALSFSRHLYFTVDASHLENTGKSDLLAYAYSPIPVYAASQNAPACVEIIKRIREGLSVCMFPEGVRSGDGLTGEIPYNVARLVKKLGVCMVTYKIDGAYMSHPSWAKYSRRGKTYGHTVCIYPAENIRKMSVSSIYQAIKSVLSSDAIASQAEYQTKFIGKKLAEGIEKQLYACPSCKYLNTLTSSGNKITCSKCQKSGEIDALGNISGFAFSNVRDWSSWQKGMIEKLPYISTEKEIAFDDSCSLFEVKRDFSEELICFGRFSITNISLKLEDREILFDNILRAQLTFDGDLAFATKNCGNSHYEIRSENGYAAIMYLEIYKRFRKNKT